MAGDEKHARELIAEAGAFTAASVIGKPTAREIDRAILLIRKLRGALEAVLPGDDDWEYRYAEATDPVAYTYGPEHDSRGSFQTYEEASAARIEDSDLVVRRRPAGPWEPVEEAPRGDAA